MTNTYLFSCQDHSISIKADSLQEAKDKLERFLTRGSSEELYNINDYTLCEEAPYYV